jgi:hypothetical protein
VNRLLSKEEMYTVSAALALALGVTACGSSGKSTAPESSPSPYAITGGTPAKTPMSLSEKIHKLVGDAKPGDLVKAECEANDLVTWRYLGKEATSHGNVTLIIQNQSFDIETTVGYPLCITPTFPPASRYQLAEEDDQWMAQQLQSLAATAK